MSSLPEVVRRRLGERPTDLTRLGSSRVLQGNGYVVKVGPQHRIARETYVLRDLRQRLPLAVPELVDIGEGWMLLTDVGPDDPPGRWSPVPMRDLAALHREFTADPAVDHPSLADPFGAPRMAGPPLPAPLDALAADPSPLVAALADLPVTLVHGDAWHGNLLWRGERPWWLDWEEASRAPAVADLATWLYGTPFVAPSPAPAADLAAYEQAYGPVDRRALEAAYLLLFLTLDVPVLSEIRNAAQVVADRAARAARWLDG